MRHRFPKLLAACVIAFQLAMATLWVRSYFVGEILLLPDSLSISKLDFRALVSSHGHLNIVDSNFLDDFGFGWYYLPSSAPHPGVVEGVPPFFDPPENPTIFGIRIQCYRRTDAFGSSLLNRATAADGRTIGIPDWLVMVLGLLPILPAMRRWYRARTLHKGHCPACGYDLRSSPTRCPECGLAVTH